MTQTDAPVAVPTCVCGSTSFSLTWQAWATATVINGQIVTAVAGPGEVHDFVTTLVCTGCERTLASNDGVRGLALVDEGGESIDDTPTEDTLVEVGSAVASIASPAIMRYDQALSAQAEALPYGPERTAFFAALMS